MISRRRQRGYLLITVIVTLFLLATVAVLLTQDSAVSANTASSELEAARVEYAARAGMQNALWKVANNACIGDLDIPETRLGADSYDAKISGASAGTSYAVAADQDAWIRNDDPTKNNGTSVTNHIRQETGNVEQVLTRFDLTGISGNAQINSAIAWFHLKAGKDHFQGSVSVHEILADWAETTVTWDSFGAAYRTAPVGVIPPQTVGDTWVAINVTGLVQAWVNGRPNHGLVMQTSIEGIHTEYTAREDATNPPRLHVVVGSGDASPVTIKASGTLENGVQRKLKDKVATTFQPSTWTSLQPDGSATEDSWITSGQTDWSYGAHGTLRVQPGNQRTLLRTDLQGHVPVGARVTEAVLELYAYQVDTSDAIDAHRIRRSWAEGTCFGDCGPNDGATWDTYDGANTWTAPGGDIDPAVAATAVPLNANDWVSWDITGLASTWVADPSSNYGLMLKGNPGSAAFLSSDDADPALRPRLSIRYACGCGSACMSQQGSGNVLLVVANPASLLEVENYKKNLMESWGYTVTLLDDDASQATYDTEVAANDVVYISASVGSDAVGTKLTGAAIGIVNEEGALDDELGFSSTQVIPVPVGDSLDVIDNSHYITGVFPPGQLQIYTADMGGHAASGTLAPGLQGLANWGSSPGLAVIDSGGALGGGAVGNAAGRRVLVPFGQDDTHDWSKLNNNGRLIMQRALDWAMGADGAKSRLPIAHWKLDETSGTIAVDSIGGNDGVLRGNAAWTTGLIGGGLAVDYADGEDYVEIPNSPGLEDVQEGDYTLTAWFRPDSTPPGSNGDNDANYGILIKAGWHSGLYFTNANRFALDQVLDGNTSIGIFSGSTFSPGSFYHVAGVVDRSAGTMSLYVNGQLEDTQSFTPGTAAREYGTEPWRIGIAYGNASSWGWSADGAIDDVRIYDVALTAEEIAELATLSGPLAHWKLDDATGTTAIDSVGGHHGTLVNGPAWTSGTLDSALDFDGVNDYVDLTSDAELTDIFDGGGTVTGWIYPRSWGESDNGRILDKASQVSGDREGWMIAVRGATPAVQFAQGFTGVRGFWRSQSGTVPLNEWTHFAVVYDASSVDNDARIYLNGVEQSPLVEITPTGSIATDAGIALRMGNYAQDTSRTFDGIIDDVRIYDRMLAAGEIADLAMPPPSSTEVVYVVSDSANLSVQEEYRQKFMVDWGFTVLLLDDNATETAFTTLLQGGNQPDVIYVSQEVSPTAITAKLGETTIGIVNESRDLLDDFGFASTAPNLGGGMPPMNVDTTHYITSTLTNPVSAFGVNEWYQIVSLPVAAGAQPVGTWIDAPYTGRPALMAIATGGQLVGGTTSPARRVQLPMGSGQSATPVDINGLTADGRTLIRRSIEWAAGAGADGSGGGGGTGYVERYESFNASNSNTWQTVDLSTYGVPANAVVELALQNSNTSGEREAGARGAGSSMDRRFDLHEAESGGVDAVVVHAQADASSRIQVYAENTGDVSYRMLGYWTGASYTELAGLVTANSSGSWQSRDLASYGVSPGQIVEIAIRNTSASSEQRAGVRRIGSTLNRIVNVHEAESGGRDYVTFFVEASSDAAASIEVYAQNSTAVEFEVIGVWDTPPGTYAEAGGIVTSASQANAWHSLNAAASGVPTNAVLQMALANDTDSTERQMGLRRTGSSLNRVIDLQEGESGGADIATFHVNLDDNAQFQLYVESSTAGLFFYPLGWWVLN